MIDVDNMPICERCDQRLYGGSHYHCGGCDSADVTSMYGHHGTRCKRTGRPETFHHCGPDGDCELAPQSARPDATP